MLASRARSIADRRRMLLAGSPPPSLAAMMISRASLLKILPRCWSTLPFLILMLCHLECPDTASPLRNDPPGHHARACSQQQSWGGPGREGGRGGGQGGDQRRKGADGAAERGPTTCRAI